MEQSIENQKYNSFGGWLLFLTVVLVLNVILTFTDSFSIIELPMLLLNIGLVIFIFVRKPISPKIIRLIFIVSIVWGLAYISYFLPAYFSGRIGPTITWSDIFSGIRGIGPAREYALTVLVSGLITFVLIIVGNIAWILYFNKSERVKIWFKTNL